MTQITSLFGKPLKEPIEVTTFNVDDHYYASSGAYKIYADSSSEEEAMVNFIEQLEDMYNRYSKLNELITQ